MSNFYIGFFVGISISIILFSWLFFIIREFKINKKVREFLKNKLNDKDFYIYKRLSEAYLFENLDTIIKQEGKK